MQNSFSKVPTIIGMPQWMIDFERENGWEPNLALSWVMMGTTLQWRIEAQRAISLSSQAMTPPPRPAP